MVWYRRAFRLTREQAARPATLSLGAIDEVDETWVNGRAIRNTFGYGTARTYHLPAGTLRDGDNVIVLNVLSTWEAGGMTGPAEAIALEFDHRRRCRWRGNGATARCRSRPGDPRVPRGKRWGA